MANITSIDTVFSSIPAEYSQVVKWRKASECPHEGETAGMQKVMKAFTSNSAEYCAVLLVQDPPMQQIIHRMKAEIGPTSRSYYRSMKISKSGATGSEKYVIKTHINTYQINPVTNKVILSDPNNNVSLFGGFFFNHSIRRETIAVFCDEAKDHPKVREYVALQRAAAASTLVPYILFDLCKVIGNYL